MKTWWNKVRYSIYAPLYDIVENKLRSARQEAISLINAKPGEQILLVGCGTGLDLEHLPADLKISAIDLTPAMVAKTRQRAKKLGLQIDAEEMDAESLSFPDEQFDVVILHLVLAIVPNPHKCILEAVRVLKPDGRISIFDKFLAAHQNPSLLRKGINLITSFLFSSINRKIEPLLDEAGLTALIDKPVLFHGTFRAITARKK